MQCLPSSWFLIDPTVKSLNFHRNWSADIVDDLLFLFVVVDVCRSVFTWLYTPYTLKRCVGFAALFPAFLARLFRLFLFVCVCVFVRRVCSSLFLSLLSFRFLAISRLPSFANHPTTRIHPPPPLSPALVG